jgi:hypothetical protein
MSARAVIQKPLADPIIAHPKIYFIIIKISFFSVRTLFLQGILNIIDHEN